MSAAQVPLTIRGETTRLGCYSELHFEHARVLRPRSRHELAEIFAYASRGRRRVTLRAGGQSFDAQSLGDDLVVSMEHFDDIKVDVASAQVRVGPAASWGRILKELERHDLVPAVTVTTENATAGGTLSGDCLSRFSVAYGKEGTHIRSFELMTPEGDVIECTRPKGTPTELGGRLYLGAIGGLGYLGAVLSITYDVLRAPEGTGALTVETTVERHGDLVEYVDAFVAKIAAVDGEHSSPRKLDLHDAIYSGLALRGGDRCQALIFKSTITRGARGKPMLLYKPHSLVRVPVEWLFRWRPFNTLVWWAAYTIFYRNGSRFVNGLADYTFFMDGNARAKRIAGKFGIHLRNLQETFIIPTAFGSDDGVPQAKEDLVAWLRHAQRVFEKHRIVPSFQDVLWLPRDLDFPLSATATSAGFAVSYSFEINDSKRLRTAERALARLAADVRATWGGSVYLVKNVCAAPEDLDAMYGARAKTFFALKREVDPHAVIRNPFLERTLWPDRAPSRWSLRRVRVEHEQHYPVSLEKGFAYITDPRRWPDYWPDLVRVESGARWREAGDRARVVLRLLGRPVRLDMMLRRLEPNRLVEYTSVQRGLPHAHHERHFSTAAEGFDFRAVVEYESRAGWRGILDRVLLRCVVKRALRRTAANLRTRLRATV